jgi:hypothetical protein
MDYGNQRKPGREEQADHKSISSFPDVPEVHADCVIWLQQQLLDPAILLIFSRNSLTQNLWFYFWK